MWSRVLVKLETHNKFREYAKNNGYKLWYVYEKAFKCLLNEGKDRL